MPVPVGDGASHGPAARLRRRRFGGRLLSTDTVVINDTSSDPRDFVLANPRKLTAGQKYTFRFTFPSVSWSWAGASADNTYAGGMSSIPGEDFTFQTVMAPVLNERALVVKTGVVKVERLLHLKPMAHAPATAQAGDVYYDGTLNRLRYFNGTSWVSL